MDNELSKAERTRQFIIETTAGIFNTKGYAGTSLSDLTEATGLTKGSIYGNFENKEEVALAVFDHNYSKLAQNIQQRIEKEHTFYDKLMVYATFYHSFMRNFHTPGGCPILNTAVEADDTNLLLKERAAKAIQKWKKNIEDLIQGGIAAGEFKTDTDHTLVALSIIALIEGGIMISKVTGAPANLDKVLKTVELMIIQIKA
ncbi:MAG: TetR family transcriptional regulator [Mucilaginibacter sp.]|nr:TetR family transcriptional regulator [Mucilaginibacter sp.]